MFISGNNQYVIQSESFQGIPGNPIAYWISKRYAKHLVEIIFLIFVKLSKVWQLVIIIFFTIMV